MFYFFNLYFLSLIRIIDFIISRYFNFKYREMREVIIFKPYHSENSVWAIQIVWGETNLIFKNIRDLAKKISKVGKQTFLDHNKFT